MHTLHSQWRAQVGPGHSLPAPAAALERRVVGGSGRDARAPGTSTSSAWPETASRLARQDNLSRAGQGPAEVCRRAVSRTAD